MSFSNPRAPQLQNPYNPSSFDNNFSSSSSSLQPHPLSKILQTYRPSSKLNSILTRIAAKVEEKSRNPWYSLQRTHFYKNSIGIRTTEELRSALEYFHVTISDVELLFLFQSFPLIPPSTSKYTATQSGTNSITNELWFDFRKFADALIPDEL